VDLKQQTLILDINMAIKQDEVLFDTDEVQAVETDDPTLQSESSVVSFVQEKYNKADNARFTDEQRWLKAYKNYRGLYGSDVQFTEAEKSRVFIKVTKTKTLAAYGQIVDVLFGSSRFPLTIDPTILPDGVAEAAHFDITPNTTSDMNKREAPGAKPFLLNDKGEPVDIAGATEADLEGRLSYLKDYLSPISEKLTEGEGTTRSKVTFHPSMIAAKKMEKKIHDQLEESGTNKQLRLSAFEMALFGTGIMKGPFAVDKEYPNWNEEGDYDPLIKTVPSTSHVSIWNFYPDPDADNMDEVEYIVERHKMSRSKLRSLKKRPYFRDESIDIAIDFGEAYTRKYWEEHMEDETISGKTERYEVLEFWGYVDSRILEENGLDIPKDMEDLEQINVNIWICNGQVLRLVLNPFTPTRIPYYAVPYELNPYSFFGVGIAENMDDTQTLMNGFMRMAIDNAALSGNLIIEVDETNLVPGQDMSVYPGKIFRRQGGAPGQALFGTKFPNVAGENMQLFDKARVLADESTGFPSYAHGQTGIQGVGRTASGISMLMSAANGSIRNVVKNIDDYLLSPLGKAFFSFNMQFDFDPSIRGDLEVKAQGTESLMANEVRSQRLMQFLGVVSNPVLAPFAKMDYIVREIAKSMDLDPDKLTNSLADAAVQAELLREMNVQMQPQQGQQTPPGVNPNDPTGAGGANIGTGQVPLPNEQGFSGNEQGNNEPPQETGEQQRPLGGLQ
tara:strand:+ start:8003 stop:10192 length:2190 start_codon:yes stop_codon:yes gene_type:complete